MDGLPQRPEADASLLFLQKLDEERFLGVKPKVSQHSLAPSEAGSSSTMDHPNAADRKRKHMVAPDSSESRATKRVKIASTDQDPVVVGAARPSHYDISQQLPAEVWHHIFSLVPPLSLGKLMRVNRLFHRYLDPASPFKVTAPDSSLPSSLPKLSPDTIWRASRRSHWPNMPSPLSERSELDMWQFACSRSCQFCGQVDETDYAGDPLPWSRGPGNDTVSPIFQFFVASCGQCLVEKSVKEVDLLLSSSTPSFIAAGAPMVFLTVDLNVVPRQIMRNTPIPTNVQLTKAYWPAHLQSLQEELEDARRFGAAAVEEWVKGLEGRGAEAIRDASRWDSWSLSGGVRQMSRRASPTHTTSSSNARHVQHVESQQAREKIQDPKSKRRADIQARAAQLHPPIHPSILHKLQAFKVASEISTPLDDNEWRVLKLLLLDQRDKAEQGGRHAAPKKQATHKYPTRNKTAGIKAAEPQVLEPDSIIRTEESKPDSIIRTEVSKLADRIIKGQWDGGRSIKRQDCAVFASQVLTHVRSQFYEDSFKAKPSSARRLTLDDMRWVFTEKIAPLTDPHAKEIFACNKCLSSKRYAIEAVIQHSCQAHGGSAAKMSTHWQTEWLAELPFKPAPVAKKQPLGHTPEEGCDGFKQRAATLAKDVIPAWKALKIVPKVPPSVKASAAVYFVAKRYQELYREPPPLQLLIAGPTLESIPVRGCLACKVCKQDPAVVKNKTFKLFGLAQHFHQIHKHVDWSTGMVWVPDPCLSQVDRTAIRKNRRAFQLISDALPWLLEDKEGMDQSDEVPLQSRQTPRSANAKGSDAAAGPVTDPNPPTRPMSTGGMHHLLPASAVYSPIGVSHGQLAYRADVAPGPNTDEARLEGHEPADRTMARYSTREVEDWGDTTWEAAHVSWGSVDPEHAEPEPRSYAETYYLHREHEPHAREPPVSYPYYPDMERQRQQIHAAVEVRHTSRQPWTTGYSNPPMSSTAAYHYGGRVLPYDRYDFVDVRNLPSDHYIEYPVAYYRRRTTPMPAIPTVPTGDYIDTALASRMYNAYPSRRQLVERASRELECDLE